MSKRKPNSMTGDGSTSHGAVADDLRDRPARDRIVHDLTRNLMVEAGAGSGKTHEMAARMAAGVATGVYQIERMAAVTFTRKAAAELRGRFQLALEDELSKADLAPDRRTRIGHALSNLERFFAGTIHAFCARLLRERPIEADVSPGFTELDDVEERVLRKASWRDYRSQARARGDKDFRLLQEAGIRVSELDEAFEIVSTNEDVSFQVPDAPPPDPVRAWRALEVFWAEISKRLPPTIADDTTCRIQQSAEQFRRDWRFAAGRTRTAVRLAELLRCWDHTSKVTQYAWAADARTARRLALEAKALHEQFRAAVVTPYLTAWREHLYAPCMRVLTTARDIAAAERRRRNTLSFNDLLLLTAKVLHGHPEVRAALQQKYRYLFVDEFQDTDPVQAEIMALLTEPLEQGQPASSVLFVVGDPKQSIYRFRRADISTYNEVRRAIAGPDGAGLVSLTTNFRSVPALCTWVNAVFAATFPAQPTESQPQFAALDPHRPDAAAPAVFRLTIGPDVASAEMIEAEAARIARYIRWAVDEGGRRFADFLILTRKKKGLQQYLRALEALQVPVEVSGAGAFGESEEVRTLAELLAALGDPQDSVALVGVLRGRLFGISDPQLFAYRQAGGFLDLFNELENAPASAAPVATALATLRRWYKWTRMLPAGAALERILDDSGYLALAATSAGGVEAGDLLHAIDRVRAAVEVGFTLAEAADALEDAGQESSEVESLPLEPGRRDVVRLMNLHKAKGLEAAVVFLADPCSGWDLPVKVRIVRDGAGACGFCPIRAKNPKGGYRLIAQPPAWDAHESAETPFLEAEESRLLYVAATRAKDMLIVGWAGNGKNQAWAAFEPYLANVPELPLPSAVRPPAPLRVDMSATAVANVTLATERARADATRASWTAVSVTSELKHLPRWSLEQADMGVADDPTRSITADTASRRADRGLAWGTLVHGLLEHAMRHPSASREDLRRLGLWLTVDEPDLRPVIDRAVDTVEAAARAAFWADARTALERHEEVPFAVREESGGLPKVVNGAIDLVYGSSEAWHIVDYKTDADAADLESRYAPQLDAYRRAWQRFTRGRVESSVIAARQADGDAGTSKET